MNDLMIKMYVNLKSAMAREEGPDLVEYGLVVALIAFGAVAGMRSSRDRHQPCLLADRQPLLRPTLRSRDCRREEALLLVNKSFTTI